MDDLTDQQKLAVRALLWVGGIYVGYKVGAPKHPFIGAWFGGIVGGLTGYVLMPFDMDAITDSASNHSYLEDYYA